MELLAYLWLAEVFEIIEDISTDMNRLLILHYV